MTIAPTPLGQRPGTVRVRNGIVFALAAIGVVFALLYAVRADGPSTSAVLVGSGVPSVDTRSLPEFGDVEVAGSNNVTIRVGKQQSVSVHGDDNLVGGVTTGVESGALIIGNERASLVSRSPMKIEVTMPSLTVLTLSGSGTVTVTGLDELDVTVMLSGSGRVRAKGSTYKLTVAVTGSGQAELSQLVADDAVAVVAGSGEISVTATDSLVAAVPGMGSIVYGGNPSDVTTAVTGIGTITPRSGE